jgi:hypothetical protein
MIRIVEGQAEANDPDPRSPAANDLGPRGSVKRFFDHAAPYFAGATRLADFDSALGSGPSRPERREFYPRLMAANVRRILRAVFPILGDIVSDPRRAGLASLPPWADLCADFIASRPSGHWSPNALGEAFPEFLASRGGLPVGLVAIGDWSLRLLHAQRSPSASAAVLEGGLADGVSAALYPFDVAAWITAFQAGAADLPRAHAEGPAVFLVAFRDPAEGGTRVLRPTAVELLALGIASGEVSPADHPEVDPLALARARRHLTQRGLLRPVGAPSLVGSRP